MLGAVCRGADDRRPGHSLGLFRAARFHHLRHDTRSSDGAAHLVTTWFGERILQGDEFDSAIVARVLNRDASEVEERLDKLERVVVGAGTGVRARSRLLWQPARYAAKVNAHREAMRLAERGLEALLKCGDRVRGNGLACYAGSCRRTPWAVNAAAVSA